ncbi:ABC-type multidrug transport system, ATPase component [Corynebacterium mustelae]|uniref:ABC-type multidrug transport system, ATPase component n=1 Tax=Corynebacterium mustelae TaxID=571915 RepID=A0A0G3GXQ9_9CORY|nr:ABC transporter ATP-binding protein [Corynebacterium mustelae]AKK05325.1 ABC-type multidrug transport system, ATPase component [Corynebacterium mustelae]
MTAISCKNLSRKFKELRAVDDVTLTVEKHQIFGLLGPNGCGKTTLLNQIQGLDTPTAGSVSVLGLDPRNQREELMPRIGTQLQEAAVIPRLKVREALSTYASFYSEATTDPSELLAALGLAGTENRRVDKLSGGQRQRVFIALALIHNPELLFFDELTSALDPQSRLTIWEILRNLKAEGRTIMLTTHSMAEAEALCDRVAIMEAGKIIAEDTPQALIAAHTGGSALRLEVSAPPQIELLSAIPGLRRIECTDNVVTATGTADFAPAVITALAEQNITATNMTFTEATLEDVFLGLTGRPLTPRKEQ